MAFSTGAFSDGKSISVENDEELVSFDIVSLYTNVPVHEAIHHCADLLYNNDNELPPVSKETLIELATMSNCNVWMLTHDGFYRQKDELAMDELEDVISYLLNNGADINAVDNYNQTPLNYAAVKGNVDSITLLLNWSNLPKADIEVSAFFNEKPSIIFR